MSLNDHHDAAVTRLSEHSHLAGIIHDTVRKTKTGEVVRENHIVFGLTMPQLEKERLTGTPGPDGDSDMEVFVRVVASTRFGANDLTDAVHDQLQGWSMAVPHRSCTPFHRDELGELDHDNTTDLFHRDLYYVARSSRAA
ncbi:hypothetical protein [Microbacterium thalli]|uniref:hypothetical protein n=1 Tax=Microbacterium thalli TaxID=3027921 RepID=UPI0023660FB8|nr:hypothetical protein [Microbacterium thalli]MDD7930070.1 hypothetical protein [Microbacterium thalli]